MDPTPSMQDLGIDQWSVDDRLRLIGEIWDSLDANDVVIISEGHREELDRRLAAADADPEAGVPWEDAMERLRNRQ